MSKRILQILFTSLSLLSGAIDAIAQTVTASFRNRPLSEVIVEINSQTGFSVISSDRTDLSSYQVTAEFSGTPVSEVWPKIFKSPLKYEVSGNVIAVSLDEKRPGTQQEKFRIYGVVKDENGEPLPDAGVMSENGSAAVVTDADGRYEIMLPAGTRILKFSYINYQSKEVLIGDRTNVSVTLEPDINNSLNEAVVIGYGVTRKRDLTGSVATVKMSDLAQAPNTSIDQALQGRLAGVDVMSTSGEPGASTSIRIRGTRSINASNEPLIIVDGVIDAIHDINEINSADIESISIMKDASSTAIYGSRGANGVILITTRKGVTSRPSVVAKAEFGASRIARYLDVMNKNEFVRYLNDWYYFRSSGKSGQRFDPDDYANDTDWLREITRIAPYQNYSVSASGKVSENLNYFGSLSYNDTEGIIKNSGVEKINGRFNLNYDVAKWMRVSLRMSYSFQKHNINKADIGGTNFWNGAVYLSPIIGAYDKYNPLYENGTAINTPIANINLMERFRENLTKNDVLEFVFRPVKGLTLKSQNSVMVYQRHDYYFWPSTMPRKVEGEGADAQRYEGDARKLNTENTATYTRKIRGGHSFDVLAGFSASKNNMNYFRLTANGLLTDDLKWNNMQGVVSKENLVPYTTSEEVIKESVFARMNYNYRQKYYLTLTGRYDGSSNFAENNKWGFFPSAAMKWVISKEPFMRSLHSVDDLSLRISAGRSGNDAISYYRSLAAYEVLTNAWLVDGRLVPSMVPSRVANPNLTWEKTTLLNAALDLTMFKGRISATLEAYTARTYDLLLNLKTIQTTGYDSRLTNLGKTSNKGLELTLDTRNIEKRHFGWTTQFTVSHNKQEVIEIGQEDYVPVLNSPGNTSFMMYGYKKGYPLNSLWGFQYAGVWHTEDEFVRNAYTHSYVSNTTTNSASAILGFPRYVDQDHDGILSEKDLIYLGNSDPFLYGGLQNTFRWKNWSLGVYFNYSLGGKIYNYAELSMSGTFSANQYRYMLDAWHPLRNPDSDIPRAGTDDRMLPSSFQVHDASYLRLKNVYLSYTWDLSKHTKMLRDVTFGVSGTNLYLFTKYNGFDPDVSTSGESTLRRVDMGAYPQSKMLVFSVQLRY